MFEIEHLKSGLSISSHFGCSLNCSYCILQTIPAHTRRVEKLMDPSLLVEKLKDNSTYFLDGMTPLIINNRTDPFLECVEKDTFRILDELVEAEIKSPVIIISKLFPRRSLYSYCEKLNLIYLYSYSGISGDYNYNDLSKIDRLLQVVPKDNIYHYLRPIIPGMNDNTKDILNIINKFASLGIKGSIVSGFRVTKSNQWMIEDKLEISNNKHKFFCEELYEKLCKIINENMMSYEIFRHTSCAIDSFMSRKNRLNYYLRAGHCNQHCKNKSICERNDLFSIESVMHEIEKRFNKKIDYKLENGVVCIQSVVSEEEIAFIKNAYGIDVYGIEITKSPSEEYILYE